MTFHYTRTIKSVFLGSAMLTLVSNAAAQTLTRFVDPFIGTGGHGHTYPGATVPFSLVQLSPDNGKNGWDWVSGYHISADSIAGFSHMHLSGTGIGDWLDIAIMPMLKPIKNYKIDTRVSFSHANESAGPGYYAVQLDNQIQARLTATERVGYHQYQFPASAEPTVRLDLNHAYNWDKPTDTEIQILNDSTVVGKRYSYGWANQQHIYFAIRFSAPFKQYLLNGKESSTKELRVENLGKLTEPAVNAQFIFPNSKQIELKVALSTSNQQKALLALNEIPNWSF